MSYDKKFREKVLEHVKKGHTQQETAELFGISWTTLKRWKKQLAEEGTLAIKPRQRNPRKISPEKLLAYLNEHPDAYLAEMANEFSCSIEGVRKVLIKTGITRKKRHWSIGNAMKRSEKTSVQ